MLTNQATQADYYEMDSSESISREGKLPPATVSFSTPIANDADLKLDIKAYLIKRPASTFFMRAEDNDLTNCGINQGDLLIVDRSLPVINKSIVIVNLDGQLLLKKILISSHTTYLTPWTTRSTLFKITPNHNFEIWGVVAYNIHKL
jgi:DNA polymerase V